MQRRAELKKRCWLCHKLNQSEDVPPKLTVFHNTRMHATLPLVSLVRISLLRAPLNQWASRALNIWTLSKNLIQALWPCQEIVSWCGYPKVWFRRIMYFIVYAIKWIVTTNTNGHKNECIIKQKLCFSQNCTQIWMNCNQDVMYLQQRSHQHCLRSKDDQIQF